MTNAQDTNNAATEPTVILQKGDVIRLADGRTAVVLAGCRRLRGTVIVKDDSGKVFSAFTTTVQIMETN